MLMNLATVFALKRGTGSLENRDRREIFSTGYLLTINKMNTLKRQTL